MSWRTWLKLEKSLLAACTENLFFTYRNFLHTDAFTYRHFYTQHRKAFTQTLWHRRFYTDAFTQMLLHTEAITHTQKLCTHTKKKARFFKVSFWLSTLSSCEGVATQFLAIEPHFVRKGCAGRLEWTRSFTQFFTIEPHFVQKGCGGRARTSFCAKRIARDTFKSHLYRCFWPVPTKRHQQPVRTKRGSIAQNWTKIPISTCPGQPFRTKWDSMIKKKLPFPCRPAEPFLTKGGSIVKKRGKIAISELPSQPFGAKPGSTDVKLQFPCHCVNIGRPACKSCVKVILNRMCVKV